MKRMIWISIFVLFAITVCCGCLRKMPSAPEDIGAVAEVEEDGYRKDSTDTSAAKSINSNEITSFECLYSVVPYEDADTELEYDSYQFEAFLEDGIVKGNYYASSRYGDEIQETFETDIAFMEELQKIVSKHNLAENNGHFVEVKGLPDMYGAKLRVTYASGEQIYAYDNESSFLSIAAMEAVEEVFRRQLSYNIKEMDDDVESEVNNSESPQTLDITVSMERQIKEVEGCFLEVTYPVLSLGYPYWDGTMRGAQGFNALQDALDQYNMTVRMDQESKLHSTLPAAAKQLTDNGEEARELYAYTDAFVTRSDESVLSFYERITWYEWWLEEQYFWGAYNYDAKTGKLLEYEDIFENVDELPALLAEELKKSYPEIVFSEIMDEMIEEAIREKTTSICFALGHDCVHFFAADNWLAHHRGGLHITIPYQESPELVKNEYRKSSDNWMMKLEYDTNYFLEEIGDLSMSWSITDEDQEIIEWIVSLNGKEFIESFYGYGPDCYLARMSGSYYIYLKLPTGDISQLTNIYDVNEEGIVWIDTAELAMYEKTGVNPERILMYGNDMVFAEYVLLMPYSMYSVGENGDLILSARDNEFGLEPIPLVPWQSMQVLEIDPEDADKVIGVMDIDEETVLTPLRTDKETYIDFLCEDGRICSFSINGFQDDMILDGIGTFSELFVPKAHLELKQP